MKIEVFGPGCRKCTQTEKVVRQVVDELGLEVEIIKVDDYQAIVAAGILGMTMKPSAWPLALPLILLWLASPLVAWRLSLPQKVSAATILSAEEKQQLRLIGRRTWAFFEPAISTSFLRALSPTIGEARLMSFFLPRRLTIQRLHVPESIQMRPSSFPRAEPMAS